jgi:Asp-tRNA(Asn)/Glu-tRNA(Gln) amidotransferase A subunit family amidase
VAGAALAIIGTGLGTSSASAAEEGPSAGFLAPYYTAGDLTGDSQIDQADLDALTAAIGTISADAGWAAVAPADYDDDGEITLTDVTQLSQRILYDDGPFELVEASALDMQKAMNAGVTTSVELTQDYLDRIAAYDKKSFLDFPGRALNSIISTNSAALTAAAESDAARAANGGPRSMLDGIPIILKDNYDTKDMPTTAGCECFKANQTADDATMVADLREQGAVILAKASMDEFAINLTSTISIGQTEPNQDIVVSSPYNLARTSGGSSGGTGSSISSNLGAIGFGTDTGGSIRVPSSYNQLVGIRPTVGLTSRSGIVPLALSQDTGGPLARSVTDAAIALDAVAGADPSDPVTAESNEKIPESYTQYLDPDALKGKKIGYVASTLGTNATVARLFNQAVTDLEAQGADVVLLTETADLERISRTGGYGSGSTNEFKHDLQAYIDTHLNTAVPYRSLDAIAKSGKVVSGRGDKDATGNGTYSLRSRVTEETYQSYIATHNTEIATGEKDMTDLLDANDLDALIYPTSSTYTTIGTNLRLSPNSGMPAVTVPMGQATAADGATAIVGAGVNLEFLGRNYAEGDLIGLTYDFEQATHHRTTPALFPELAQ